MSKLPIVICSSVIRSSQSGESHGGVYIVDLEHDRFKQVIDWNDNSIDWDGRGGDRGLRGISFYKNHIIFAASDEIFFYDKKFKYVKSFKNPYLKHCHEIFVYSDVLYVSSTGFDSILEFDLKSEKFKKGYVYRSRNGLLYKTRLYSILKNKLNLKGKYFKVFVPLEKNGPELRDSSHINNVFVNDGSIYFSGTGLKNLLKIDKSTGMLSSFFAVPKGTHNVSLFKNSIVYNNTQNDQIRLKSINNKNSLSFSLPEFNDDNLLYKNVPNDHARKAFGRGLSFYKDFIIGGSSPSSISVYSIKSGACVKTINLSLDVRNAIHGLEIYPYEIETNFFE